MSSCTVNLEQVCIALYDSFRSYTVVWSLLRWTVVWK